MESVKSNCIIYPDIRFALKLKSFCTLIRKQMQARIWAPVYPHTHKHTKTSSINTMLLSLRCLSSFNPVRASTRYQISESSNASSTLGISWFVHIVVHICCWFSSQRLFSCFFSSPRNIFSIDEMSTEVPFLLITQQESSF